MSVPGRSHDSQCEADGIRAILFHDFQRINNVPFGFAHLLAFRISNQTVEVHDTERNITHELHTQHDHSSDPEKDDVVTRDQSRGGIKLLEVFGLFGPTQ